MSIIYITNVLFYYQNEYARVSKQSRSSNNKDTMSGIHPCDKITCICSLFMYHIVIYFIK